MWEIGSPKHVVRAYESQCCIFQIFLHSSSHGVGIGCVCVKLTPCKQTGEKFWVSKSPMTRHTDAGAFSHRVLVENWDDDEKSGTEWFPSTLNH